VAQGEFAELVDGVVTDTKVCVGVGGGGGFGSGVVGGLWGESAGVCAVDALSVVDDAECVEEGLEVGDGGRPWSGGQPAFEGLVKPLDFALGLGVAGVAVFLR
jgi:hypothetical protein